MFCPMWESKAQYKEYQCWTKEQLKLLMQDKWTRGRFAELIVQLAGVCGLTNPTVAILNVKGAFFCWGPTNGSVLIKIQYSTNLTQQVTRTSREWYEVELVVEIQ